VRPLPIPIGCTKTNWQASLMTVQLENQLITILALREGSSKILKNRESTQIEFKQSFNLANLPQYARTMTAYSNTEGGFLVFGVSNAPREIVGVNVRRFDSIEPAKITAFLNAHLSPEIAWELGLIDFAGFKLGFLYTEEHTRKPVVVTTNSGKDLKEGEIYYRYRGQTTAIKYPELRAIIDARLDEERRGWLQHLGTISRSGPSNVAILDTIQGKLFGAGAPFLIDESLLRQIKFIREGHFTESTGAPALKLVGELKTLGAVTAEKVVHRGIHFEDLVTAFLASRHLDPEDAKSYLMETCHQMSPYSPIFYFVRSAGISLQNAIQLLEDRKCGLRSTRRDILKRLSGERTIAPIGAIVGPLPSAKAKTTQELGKSLSSLTTQKAKRSLLLVLLTTSPNLIASALPSVPIPRLVEAITHLKQPHLIRYSKQIRDLLLILFGAEFDKMKGIDQSAFRKAVAFLDQELNMQDNQHPAARRRVRSRA